jgi:hypothetical protein
MKKLNINATCKWQESVDEENTLSNKVIKSLKCLKGVQTKNEIQWPGRVASNIVSLGIIFISLIVLVHY